MDIFSFGDDTMLQICIQGNIVINNVQMCLTAVGRKVRIILPIMVIWVT